MKKKSRMKKTMKIANKKKAKSPKMAHKETSSQDIVQLIVKDHKPLKELIATLKDLEMSLSERREAFEEFGPALLQHAKPEEQVLYKHLKDKHGMREEGLEGEVEHSLADQLLEEAKTETDDDLWSAKVKILAELVEHHIQEEEGEMFHDFKRDCPQEEREMLGQRYLEAKENYIESDKIQNPKMYPPQTVTHA